MAVATHPTYQCPSKFAWWHHTECSKRRGYSVFQSGKTPAKPVSKVLTTFAIKFTILTSLEALLMMLPCEFQGILIHGMSSNGHRKIGRPEISSSKKTVAPKNRGRAMLQDRLVTHPRPWALGSRCQLQSYSQIQSANRELHWILVYYESHTTFCMDFVQESVT